MQAVELLFIRQLAVPQQMGDLFVAGDGHQVLDQVSAAIDEAAVGAVDFADGGFSGHHTFQPGAELRHFETNSRWSRISTGTATTAHNQSHGAPFALYDLEDWTVDLP